MSSPKRLSKRSLPSVDASPLIKQIQTSVLLIKYATAKLIQLCLSTKNYIVEWVSVPPIEYATAKLILDEKHQNLSKHVTDSNMYLLGQVGEYNIIIVYLLFR